MRDLGRDESCLEVSKDRGTWRDPSDGWTFGSHAVERYRAHHGDFTSVRGETTWKRTFARGDGSTRTETRTVLSCDARSFRVRADLDAYEGDRRVHCRSWDVEVPRRLL